MAQLDGAAEYTSYFSAKEYNPPLDECPGFDTKQSNGEFSVILELWGIRSTLSLALLPDPLWPGMLVPDMGQIELFKVEMFDHLTVCKQMTDI